jgi:hypothetical protein
MVESVMAAETEAAAGNATINYEAASTELETAVVAVVAVVGAAAALGTRGRQQWQRLHPCHGL